MKTAVDCLKTLAQYTLVLQASAGKTDLDPDDRKGKAGKRP